MNQQQPVEGEIKKPNRFVGMAIRLFGIFILA